MGSLYKKSSIECGVLRQSTLAVKDRALELSIQKGESK